MTDVDWIERSPENTELLAHSVRSLSLFSNLAVPEYNELLRRQTLEADWSACVELIGRYADLRSESVLPTV